MTGGDTVVAVIPQDERNRTLAPQKNAAWSHPLPAEVHAGPYLIRGNVLEKGPKLGAFSRNGLLMRELALTQFSPQNTPEEPR